MDSCQRNAVHGTDRLKTNHHFLTDVNTQPETFGINLQKPKFPQYAVLSKREESFKSWPEYLPLKPDVFVEAGLVYTGANRGHRGQQLGTVSNNRYQLFFTETFLSGKSVGDSVRCYYCGGGLRNWEAVDIPFVEHAKWYPTCPHVLLVKGQSYVDAITRGETPEVDAPLEKACPQPEEDIINTAAAQSCIQNNFSEKAVKEAADVFIKKNGNSNFTGIDLCKILFDREESLDLAQSLSNVTLATTGVSCSANATTKPVLEASGGAELEITDDIDELLYENQRLKENQTCKICLDDIANVIFLPCGHMVSCPQCAPALNKCPICRDNVKGYVKAYFGSVSDKS